MYKRTKHNREYPWGSGEKEEPGRSQEQENQAGTQRADRMIAKGGVNGGRSHGGDLPDDTWGTTDVDEDDGRGALGADGEQMGPGDTNGPGGRGGAAATSV